MSENTPRGFRRYGRFFIRLLLVLVIPVFAGGLTLWRAPIWVAEYFTQLQLLRAGIHSRSTVIEGNDIHYMEGGTGQPVVLIHGLGSQGQQDWAKLAPYLVCAGYHVYAPDLLGYGRSAKPADHTYSIREEAKFVESFLDAKHLNTITLGGVSMGGWIASTVALDQPERVARLILVDSAGMQFKLSFDPVLFTPQTSEQITQLKALVTNVPRPLPEFVNADFIQRTKRNGWVVRRALASMTTGADNLDERFSALKMPMLIVWGKEDAITPLSVAESMHRAAPQSVLAVYGGCGHIAVVTCMDRIAPTVLDFLSGAGLQPGQTIEDSPHKP